MASIDYKNRYCPECLAPVDPISGDHWHYCEYEATIKDWVNPEQPLTELEMLNKKLIKSLGNLKGARSECREHLKCIDRLNKGIATFVCPRCTMESFHPKDIQNRYCGECGYVD